MKIEIDDDVDDADDGLPVVQRVLLLSAKFPLAEALQRLLLLACDRW